ncbi:MAG: methionine--tRNA ligase [Desertimonas sp.]
MTTPTTTPARRTYLTVAIPYVNAPPHLGYAFELVEADLVARARRRLGEEVRFLAGTDDHSLKNVLAAEAAGVSPAELVAANGDRFRTLVDALDVSVDDFIRTSTDRRHRPSVERLWMACATSGDLYRRPYAGRYCVGCEQFYDPDALVDGRCPEHDQPLQDVVEDNWFFRLSRWAHPLTEAITSGRLLIEPRGARDEVLAFIAGGLDDVSVSRSTSRARGWGVPVPGDPDQVVAVWFDALTNYLSALGYAEDDPAFDRWWRGSDERIHIVGKGIVRFHAVLWPAFLLSAGLPLPTRIHVHPYLSIDGAKIAKSSGPHVDPIELAETVGVDGLRWWLAVEPSGSSDTDFTLDRLVERHDDDLANGLGNTVHRITSLRRRAGLDAIPTHSHVASTPDDLAPQVARALADFDRRRAAGLVRGALTALNRAIEHDQPWQAIGDPTRDDELVALLAEYVGALRSILLAVDPLVPGLARRLLDRLGAPGGGAAPVPRLRPHDERLAGRRVDPAGAVSG